MSSILAKIPQDVKYDTYDTIKYHLIRNLPSAIPGWVSKEDFHIRTQYSTSRQLNYQKWIEYNQEWLNFLIFDIDNNNLTNTLNTCKKLGIEPTFGCSTDKGCHLFFQLENIIKYEWDKAISYARDIKYAITEVLGADANASHRLKGIWRNPIQNDDYFYTGKLYRLDDFKPILLQKLRTTRTPNQSFKKHIVEQKIKNSIFNFTEGNRNEYLFRTGMFISKNTDMAEEDVFNYLLDLQDTLTADGLNSPLSKKEIRTIARSINSYNKGEKRKDGTTKSNYISNHTKTTFKEVQYGVMEFQSIGVNGWLEKPEYEQEVKRRQQLSQKRTSQIKLSKSKQKILETIKTLEEKGIEPNQYQIIKHSGLSKNTVKKHLKEME